MKTVEELAKHWADLNTREWIGDQERESVDLEGAMLAAYEAGYAQARYEALTNFPPIKSSGGWKLATIEIGGEEGKE